MSNRNTSCRNAVTFIEVLIVIAIIAILAGLIIPAVLQAQEIANRTHCANNLRQIGVAYHLYVESHGNNSSAFKGNAKWQEEMLKPYVEEIEDVFRCVSLGSGADSAPYRYGYLQ